MMRLSLACVFACLVPVPWAFAITPSPLENAYWRMEEGAAGNAVPTGPNTVLDSINANHLRTCDTCIGPTYTTNVPVNVIPQTGAADTLALHFNAAQNQDIYADGKNIDNPQVTAFTVEAAFYPEAVGGNAYHAIIGKDGQPVPPNNEQTFVLKVRGDNNNLQVEQWDRSGVRRSVQSAAPLTANQWYYAAVVNDGTTLSLYLNRRDGNGYVLQGTSPVSGGPLWEGTSPTGDYTSDWDIGRGQFAGNNTDWFTGVIDEVRLSNTALTPQDFLFTLRLPGDFDHNNHVDMADFALFQACGTGDHVPYNPQALPAGCTLTPDNQGKIPADFDRDGDVDMDDFAVFQRNYTG